MQDSRPGDSRHANNSLSCSFFKQCQHFPLDNALTGYGKRGIARSSPLAGEMKHKMSIESAQEPPRTGSSILCRDERSGSRL